MGSAVLSAQSQGQVRRFLTQWASPGEAGAVGGMGLGGLCVSRSPCTEWPPCLLSHSHLEGSFCSTSQTCSSLALIPPMAPRCPGPATGPGCPGPSPAPCPARAQPAAGLDAPRRPCLRPLLPGSQSCSEPEPREAPTPQAPSCAPESPSSSPLPLLPSSPSPRGATAFPSPVLLILSALETGAASPIQQTPSAPADTRLSSQWNL